MPMTRRILLIAVTMLFTVAANGETRRECEARVQAEIDRIDARMRSPYSNAEGERLRQKLRQLQDERYACRKVRPAR